MRIELSKTIRWYATFNDDGSATATLVYADFIPASRWVELVDHDNNIIFMGLVSLITLVEVGVGFQIDLEDPLSAGALDGIVWQGMPQDFPEGSTKREIDAWSLAHGVRYHYTSGGVYVNSASSSGGAAHTVHDFEVLGRVTRFGVNRDGYFNRIVVTGRAAKDIFAEPETVTLSYEGITVTETRQGNRLIARHVVEGDSESNETWQWDTRNVCTRYTNEETFPSRYKHWIGTFRDRTRTLRTAIVNDDDISEYTIHQEVIQEAWRPVVTGTQSYIDALEPVREEVTDITRSADGSGTKSVHVREIARNRYTGTMTRTIDGEEVTITFPLFPFYEMLDYSGERTIYRRVNDRPYSFTMKSEARLMALSDTETGVGLSRAGSAFGYSEPEQPEMEEAIQTISAEVEHYEEWNQNIGVFERRESLPHIDIPEWIGTNEALHSWLHQRAVQFARSLRARNDFRDEIVLTLPWSYRSREIAERVWNNGTWEVSAMQYTYDRNTMQVVITGARPSTQTLPRRSQLSPAAMLIGTMRKLDENQDNIQSGRVIRPISSSKALVESGGRRYEVANPVRGPLWAGDGITLYRTTGNPPRPHGGVL